MTAINIRRFPDQLHREAKSVAALLGMTLKDLFIQAVREFIENHKKDK